MTPGQSPARSAAWRSVLGQAGTLALAALVLAGVSWSLRTPRFPLVGAAEFYEFELPAPLVDLDRALQLYQEGDHLFVDTRPSDQRDGPYIPGAFFIAEDTFADDLREVADFLFPEDALILYGDGNLQGVAVVASRFLERGYENLQIMSGGLSAWQKAGGPTSGGSGGGDE